MPIKNRGQYFTPDYMADFMISLARITPESEILEPACGEGVFIRLLEEKGYRNCTGYEIDPSLKPVTKTKINHESFVSARLDTKFDLVIGNPPYIRWKNLEDSLKAELRQNDLWKMYFNNLCDYLFIFILKSVKLLREGGQLIFITPEYWINTKHAQPLRDYLVENGYFSDIFHFSEAPIFDGVTSSIVVFRYVKGSSGGRQIRIVRHRKGGVTGETLNRLRNNSALTAMKMQFERGKPWILAPPEDEERLALYERKCSSTLGEIADIGNGMVSGLDKAFRIPSGMILTTKEEAASIDVVKAKQVSQFFHGEVSRYIFINGKAGDEAELRREYPHFFRLLSPYRSGLEKRYSYNREIPYWEWVFPRSHGMFRKPEAKLFVPCKERISHKAFVRFAYIEQDIFPTQDVTAVYMKPGIRESIYYILALLNSPAVFEWTRLKGVIRGGVVEFSERPLSAIPVKRINWDNGWEVRLHEEIVTTTKEYIRTKEDKEKNKIGLLLERLIGQTASED